MGILELSEFFLYNCISLVYVISLLKSKGFHCVCVSMCMSEKETGRQKDRDRDGDAEGNYKH